jgi:hypothetical protein
MGFLNSIKNLFRGPRTPTFNWKQIHHNADDLLVDISLIEDKVEDDVGVTSIRYTPELLKQAFLKEIYNPLKILTQAKAYRSKKWIRG